jgi:hypothetical protein
MSIDGFSGATVETGQLLAAGLDHRHRADATQDLDLKTAGLSVAPLPEASHRLARRLSRTSPVAVRLDTGVVKAERTRRKHYAIDPSAGAGCDRGGPADPKEVKSGVEGSSQERRPPRRRSDGAVTGNRAVTP